MIIDSRGYAAFLFIWTRPDTLRKSDIGYGICYFQYAIENHLEIDLWLMQTVMKQFFLPYSLLNYCSYWRNPQKKRKNKKKKEKLCFQLGAEYEDEPKL